MSPLDNPIWHSLTSRHAHLAIGEGSCRRYPPEITPFAALADATPEATARLLELTQPGERIGILNVHPPSLDGWQEHKRIGIVQYVWEDSAGRAEPDPGAIPLDESHLDRMLELTALVYPAYFRSATARLGAYFGVVEGDRLCAMAGIRMAFDGHQEISAVCTHPDFRGRGYASRLTRHLIHHIQSQGDTPFLHTEDYNEPAQRVYDHLGFTHRATLPFLVADRV